MKKIPLPIWVVAASTFVLLAAGAIVYTQFFEVKAKKIWLSRLEDGIRTAEWEQRPILMAVVEKPCSDPWEPETPESRRDRNPKGCPDPETKALEGFVLVEVLKSSQQYTELGYDDRFLRELDDLPKFFLLSPTGELRDLSEVFPAPTLLDRWSRLR